MLIALEAVTHRFGGLVVLSGVSLGVDNGEIVGLIGPNGSGKTTLFNIINGFLVPERGRILYEGADVTRASVQERSRRGIVRTFQICRVFSNMTVLENVVLGLYKGTKSGIVEGLVKSRRSRRELRIMYEAAEVACHEFGLTSIRFQVAGTLSAGQQRLVEVVRAAISRPRLLLLDEPSQALNRSEIDQLYGIVKSLNAGGTALLLVSHDMDFAMTLSQRVYVLDFGRVIAVGTPGEVQGNDKVRDVYLGAGR